MTTEVLTCCCSFCVFSAVSVSCWAHGTDVFCAGNCGVILSGISSIVSCADSLVVLLPEVLLPEPLLFVAGVLVLVLLVDVFSVEEIVLVHNVSIFSGVVSLLASSGGVIVSISFRFQAGITSSSGFATCTLFSSCVALLGFSGNTFGVT